MADGYLVWKEIYNTGIDSIDNQHKQLLLLANRIYEASQLKMDNKDEYIKSLLKQAVSLTIAHFSHEEELMRRYEYPEYAAHLKEHNLMRRRLQTEVERISKTNRIDTFRIAQFIKDWLMHHVAISDSNYKIFFVSQGIITEKSPTDAGSSDSVPPSPGGEMTKGS